MSKETVTVTMTREQARVLLARAGMCRAGTDPPSDQDFADFVMGLSAIRGALAAEKVVK